MLCGILNVDKPPGVSSAYVVSGVKRLLPRGIKIGHAGTLDPFATGVLLLLVGKATKACEQLMGTRKGYDATVKFGARTPTDDPESTEEPVAVSRIPDEAEVRAAAAQFVGAIEQRPPAFSALKVDGQRAYKLARRGDVVELKPRTVRVYSLDLIDYAWPLARLRIECGRGTYIRAIARDLGDALNVGGHLTQLRRTFVGDYHAKTAVTPEQLKVGGIEPHLLPLPSSP
jgi:tRNA pseudouridine55 synthase